MSIQKGNQNMKFSTRFVSATREYSTFEKQIPAPYFRKSFTPGKVSSAEVTICGLGFYELFINGQRITRGLLSSYIANPDDILYYDNYDLTPYLTEGENVIGVQLGNGMIDCFGGQVWEFEKARFRSAPKFALTFESVSEDGTKTEFDAADGFVCTESPVYLDDLRVGEFYDARREIPGWNKPGFDASAWRETIPAETPRGECRICDCDPILPTREIKPVSIKPGRISKNFEWKQALLAPLSDEIMFEYPEDEKPENGFIYDFGVNAAGLCRLHIKNARPGQKIILQFGETLTEDGGLDMRGMPFLPRRYNHRDIYICRGGDETWMPSFTYHGFEYVLVTGIDEAQATPDLLTYVVMNTSLKARSTFRCSDEMANKLWDAAIISDCANFFHFPTDCPHREKNGWTGDAALSAEQMTMALTPERNWREWLRNICKSMKLSGELPGIIPTSGWGYAWGNGPAWDIVLFNIPYFTWIYTGDQTIMRECAANMLRYINYITTRRDENGLIHIGLGDWCPTARDGHYIAPLEFTDTVICIDICDKAARMYEAMGMKVQQTFAETVAGELRASARLHLIDHSTATALGRCQTTQAMAIFYDIFSDAEKPRAVEKLIDLIHGENDSFDCGILGLRVIFHVLSAYGHTDLAYKMITKEEFPSYGYQIANGATSIWEDFRRVDDAPNSRNHHFFCDYISWFMKNLIGLNVNPYRRNPNEFLLAPKFIAALDHAEATYNAPAGEVRISWKRDDDEILYSVTLPEGAKAEIALEAGWQFDDGFTHKRFTGTTEFRIIPESKKDKYCRV